MAANVGQLRQQGLLRDASLQASQRVANAKMDAMGEGQ